MYVTKYVDNTRYGQSSAMGLAAYLEKESLLHEGFATSSRSLSVYLDKQNDVVRLEGREYFFNGMGDTFDSGDMTTALDTNVRGLKKSEARYYAFSISPSMQEITHLQRTVADTKQTLLDLGEVLPDNFEDMLIRNYLKQYGVNCMDAYAQNFHHPQVKDNSDLLWFGMVEKDRYWKSHDAEVRTNSKIDKKIASLERQRNKGHILNLDQKITNLQKQYIREYQVRQNGSDEILRPLMPKAGDNWHIHFTVSRRDITNSFNLSPNANSRGSQNHQLNGKQVRVGFNREIFKIKCERSFDELFGHHRLTTESYEQAKCLREESAFAYEKQLMRDQAFRRAEVQEFNRLKAVGYNDYYANLLQVEHLTARQIIQIKGHLIQQIHRLNPQINTDLLMDYRLDELQEELIRIEANQELVAPKWAEGIAVGIGDKTIQAVGLERCRPIHTVRKVLRQGIVMHQAVDLRREVFDKWARIYSEEWHQKNYIFDSIVARQNIDCLFAQTEWLESQLKVSIILINAREYAERMECQLIENFAKQNWPDWRSEMIQLCAKEIFGKDGIGVYTQTDFELMAKAQFLPVDAQKQIEKLSEYCHQPQNLTALCERITLLQSEQSLQLASKLEEFVSEKGKILRIIHEILLDETLSTHAKEEALLQLGLSDKGLDKELRNLRNGIVSVLERQHPGIQAEPMRKILKALLKDLQGVKTKRQNEFLVVINEFIQQELPDYYLVVERQSQLEQLLQEITPDHEEYAHRLLDVNHELTRELAPYVETLFEQHGKKTFGTEACIHNEQEFCASIDRKLPIEQIRHYEESLKEVYSKIEEKRRVLIQKYVNTKIPSSELKVVRLHQKYINRFANKQLSIEVARSKKENLQRIVEATCQRSVLPNPEYKVLDQVVRKQISDQAMSKARQVKLFSVNPQQLMIKAAVKIVNVLVKGY